MLTVDERYRLLEEASELSGRWKYRETRELLGDIPVDDLLIEPELAYLLAQAMYRCSEHKDAFRLIRRLAPICLARGKDRLYQRRLLLEGNLHVEFGDLQRSSTFFTEVLSLATKARDLSLTSASTMNLGAVAWLECKYEEAMIGFSRAIVAYESLGELYTLAGCHHNLAMVYKEMGLLQDAEAQFELSRECYVRAGATKELVFSDYERALLIHTRGEVNLARATAERAVASTAEMGDREQAEALRVLGVILRDSGEREWAEKRLSQSLMLAQLARAKLLEAEVLEELAVLWCEREDWKQARELAQRAAKIFSEVGTRSRAVRALTRIDTRRGIADLIRKVSAPN